MKRPRIGRRRSPKGSLETWCHWIKHLILEILLVLLFGLAVLRVLRAETASAVPIPPMTQHIHNE